MRQVVLTKDFADSVSVSGGSTGPAPPPANSGVAARFEPIVRITTPKSRVYTYRHLADLILKLSTSAPAEASSASRLVFAVRRPTSRTPVEVTGDKTYAAWANTPLTPGTTGAKTQYDQETMAQRRISFLPSTDIALPQDHVMEVLYSGTSVIDWTQTNSFFELTVIESDVITQVAA